MKMNELIKKTEKQPYGKENAQALRNLFKDIKKLEAEKLKGEIEKEKEIETSIFLDTLEDEEIIFDLEK